MVNQPTLSLKEQFATVPNLLSMLRLVLVPAFLYLLLNEHYLAALIILAISSFTDYLDGFLARKFNQVTRLGQLLDPAADRLYIFSILVGFSITGIIPIWLALVIIFRDFILLISYPILATQGYGPLPVHYLGKAGTFALLVGFPMFLISQIWNSLTVVVEPLAWAFVFWGVGLYWWGAYVYLRQLFSIVKKTTPKTH